jgi:ribosomal protein S6
MRIYNLTYLISKQANNQEAKTMASNLESFIQEKGGVLIGERRTKEIDLGYPIKKQNKTTACSVKFQMNPETLNQIKQKLAKTPEVLRFMVLIEEKKKAKGKRRAPKPIEKPKQKKVEIKEIEKKLEQILDESQ